jgi:hypothetical protein
MLCSGGVVRQGRCTSSASRTPIRTFGAAGPRSLRAFPSAPLSSSTRRSATARCSDGYNWFEAQTTIRRVNISRWTRSRCSGMRPHPIAGTDSAPSSSTLLPAQPDGRWSGSRTAFWPRRPCGRSRRGSRDESSPSSASHGASVTAVRASNSMRPPCSRAMIGSHTSMRCERPTRLGSSPRRKEASWDFRSRTGWGGRRSTTSSPTPRRGSGCRW